MTDSFDRPGQAERDEYAEREAGMTLHEERLVASDTLTTREVAQVRLRKRIVVEELTVTVPVRREVVDVVRVDADGTETVIDAAPGLRDLQVEDRTGHVAYGDLPAQVDAGAAHRDDGEGVVCFEERPVITTEIFAVERVKLDVTRATRTESETHEVRREEVEFVEAPAVATAR